MQRNVQIIIRTKRFGFYSPSFPRNINYDQKFKTIKYVLSLRDKSCRKRYFDTH